MIRKLLLLALIIVFAALSVALYNQYTVLPEADVAEVDPAGREARRLVRSWMPPEREAQEADVPPAPPSVSGEDVQQETPAEQEAPAVVAEAPSEPAAPKTAEPAPAEPAEQGEAPQAGPAKPAPTEADKVLGQPELTPAMPAQESPPEAEEETIERPGEASKAEKALRRGEGWAMEQEGRAEGVVDGVQQELRKEREAGEQMRLTRKDEAAPKNRIDALVDQIEKRALENVGDQTPPPAPPVAEAPAPAPKPVKKAEPEPSGPSNDVAGIDLTSDAEAVYITIATAKPIERFTYFQMRDPRRFVLDLHGAYARPAPRMDVPPNAMVKDLRTGRHPDKLRVVADLLPEPTIVARVEKRSDTELVVVLRPKQ